MLDDIKLALKIKQGQICKIIIENTRKWLENNLPVADCYIIIADNIIKSEKMAQTWGLLHGDLLSASVLINIAIANTSSRYIDRKG
jgi:hypothetical protein